MGGLSTETGIIERIFPRKKLRLLRIENKNLRELIEKILASKSVNLISMERKMVLDALIDPCYRVKARDPATKRFIRKIYRDLKGKIKYSLAALIEEEKKPLS